MSRNEKRLFFGFALKALWPEFGEGKILASEDRHLTLAFLGNQEIQKTLAFANDLRPKITLTPAGIFDGCLLLPSKKPRVLSYHVDLKSGNDEINYLIKKFEIPKFLPHVTVARDFKDPNKWKELFSKRPVLLTSLHLYESLGNSNYQSLWEKSFLPAIEEKEHTADIAYMIRGRNYKELHIHAELALSFSFPEITAFFEDPKPNESLEEVIIELNNLVTRADSEVGCPFKAVSFHGDVQEENEVLIWEMIIDV